MIREIGLSLLPPIAAAALETLLFPWISPFIWILFYPAVFLSGRIGGFRGGAAATVLSITLAWYCFLPPRFSFEIAEPKNLVSVVVFAAMGYWFSRTHENLRRRQADSDARFFLMFETSAIGVSMMAADRQHFLRVNSKLCEMLGYSAEELRTKTFLDVTHPDDRTISVGLREKILAGGAAPSSMEKRYLRKDGTSFWGSVSLSVDRSPGGEPGHYIAVVEDIDARKQAELGANAARSMLEAALAAMSDAVFIIDADGSVVLFNNAFLALHSFPGPSEAPVDLAGFFQLFEVMSEDGAPVSAENWPVPRALRGETVSVVEYIVRRKDTGEAWIGSFNAAPIRDARGSITGAVLTARDITKRKTVERALRESERRLHLFIEYAPAALAMFDRGMRYMAASRRWREDFELGDDVIGRNHYEVFGDMPSHWIEAHKKGLSGEVVRNDEDCYRRPNGMMLWATWEVRPWRTSDGAIGGIVIFTVDITERKRIELALRESEQRLHLFIEYAPAALAMFDREMRYLAASRRWREEHGLPEDVIGSRSYESFPDTPQHWRDAHARGLAGEVVQNNEDCLTRADGSVQWLRWEIRPWRAGDGSVGGILVFAEDITTLRNAREEVLRLNADLERRVEERTAEAIEARARAEAANAAKTAFLANMSHEIRTPMNAILGFTRLLRREATTNLENERLENIDRAGKHLLSVINDVLDLSKIEAGRLTLETRDFDVGQILADVGSLIAAAAKAKGIVVRVDTDHMPRRVQGDDVRIRQALLNYANNAVKFTMYGSIDLRAILIEQDDDSLVARFEVEDTGMGVEPQFVPKLFKPFEQGDVSTTRKFGGTGLGLTITRRLAEMMGGEAGVESRPGVGSTFWFTARLMRSSGKVAAPENQSGAARCRSGARILLAEDNAINRQVATQLLNSFNLRVETAEDGVEALEKAQAGDYDLVLMDVQMPKMDGVEATRRLRALEGWAEKPIIALTANIFEDDRRACAEAGMNDFIPKPVDPDELYRALARWIPAEQGGAPGAMDERTTAVIERLTVAGLDAKAGLNRVAGDAALYCKLLSRFVKERADAADSLAAAPDLEARARIAHELKGVAGTLGATKVHAAAAAIESALPDSDVDALIVELRHEMQSLIAAIQVLAGHAG